MERVRTEFKATIGETDLLNLETSSELTYLGNVLKEALRLNPVAPISSPVHFKEDTKLGPLVVKAKEIIMINFVGLHLNAKQW